ncbi:hypothetical protein [Desulfoluna spongiiphila]|uniref:Uncharacterized protein n=1 Tax=Desulfoluna spongiiphila TaxID=419481 RepID=A0A1G5FI59_9BACT|nr:hypothetical protein [Desulfoluna spongiiphila]SCY38318.1 hypothetical protein SAMN05216233_10855 [Desulfoluna spongiiphila]
MKSFVKMICAAVLLSVIASGCSKEDETPMIQESFKQYKSAILNQDGFTAYYYVDSHTKAYYDDMLDKVMNASEYETKNMSLGSKVIVTMARHSISANTLRGMNGESFFIYAVENGWIGEESVSRLEIAVSNVDKNFAKTHIVDANGEAPFGFTFRKEDKTWRIDLTSMLPMTEMALEEQIKEIGIDEETFIRATLTQASGFQPDSSIWEPVNL